MNLKLLVSCYLRDVIGQARGCIDTVTGRIGSAWKPFSTQGLSLVNCRKLFKACVRSVLLYRSETWPLSTENLSQIKRCENAMIRWLYNVKIEQKQSTENLRRIHRYSQME